MKRHRPENDNHTLEQVLGNVLRTGVLVSASVVLLGGLVYLYRHGLELPSYDMFRGEPADLRALGGILRDAVQLKGRGIIQLGLVLLMATPVARVLFASWSFARERDWVYVGIGVTVFCLLVFGLVAEQALR